MDLPVRRTAEDMQEAALAPIDGPLGYLHHEDGSWSFVGDDGWPVSPEEYYAELDADVSAALAAVEGTVVDEDLLLAVRRGLESMPVIDVEPVSVRDLEV